MINKKTKKIRLNLSSIILFFIFFFFFSLSSFSFEVKKIAVLISRNIKPYNQAVTSLKKHLSEKKIKAKYLSCFFDENPNIMSEIKEFQPHLVVTIGTEVSKYFLDKKTLIPQVYSMVLNPVQNELRQNNLTGVCLSIPLNIQFERINQLLPEAKIIGMLSSSSDSSRNMEIQNVAKKIGLKMQIITTDLNDLLFAQKKLLKTIDVLWAEVDQKIYNKQTANKLIIETFKQKKPFVAFSANYVKAGALMALESDYAEIGTQTGQIVIQILINNLPTDSIPIVYQENPKCFINGNTLNFLNLKIPKKMLNEVKVFEP